MIAQTKPTAADLLKTEVEKMEAKGTITDALTEPEQNDYIGKILKEVINERETLERSADYWKSECQRINAEQDDRKMWELVLALAPTELDSPAIIDRAEEILIEFHSHINKLNDLAKK